MIQLCVSRPVGDSTDIHFVPKPFIGTESLEGFAGVRKVEKDLRAGDVLRNER